MVRKFVFLILSFLLVIFACEDKVEPKYEIIFEPSELNFGKVEANTIVSQKIRIKNTENSTGVFTGEIEILDSPKFTMYLNGVLTLQKNESKEISITFHPSAAEQYTGKLVVSNKNSFNEMYMYGEGVEPVSFTFTPNSLDFGLVKEGEYKDLDLTITNSASSGFDLEISYSISSSEFSIIDGVNSQMISPGKSVVISIRYSPTSPSVSKKITINHNSSSQNNPLIVFLFGIMDQTTEIDSLISEGWSAFENGDFNTSTLKFQEAINFASPREFYDSLHAEALVGHGWSLTFEREYSNGHSDFSKALDKFKNTISDNAHLDALAGKAIAGRLINDYTSSIEAAVDLLNRKATYQFSHKPSVDYKDVRMALVQSYYNTGKFTMAAKEMDILDPPNAPHSTDPTALLAAIQALSGTL
ncbi:choice-of-anchor D domain-containing protein [Caldithrix abyssi]|nr:choice-of-anchor D domain-containing protein [Caldithrix abyssi]